MTGGDLGARLRAARGAGRALLVPYLTAGYPDEETSSRTLAGLADAGADAVELGVPFSDPLADGPAIAAASQAALERGASLERAIALGVGRPAGPPLVLFTYLNPILARGPERVAGDLVEAGFAGALIADLPFDEGPDVRAALAGAGLPLVRLAAPTTPLDRLRDLARGAEGFVYLIARTGVTGSGAGADARLVERVAAIREETDLPVLVGFGIADADDARRAAGIADGVVIGTAFVRRLGERGPAAALEWLAGIRAALDRG